MSVAHVRGLVESGAQEAFDLDFKLTAYGKSDAERRALAGDVAALANTAGGMIIIGVDEDYQARATAAPGIAVSDAEVGRIRQVVAALVSPLPSFDALTVVDDELDGEARGFIVIAVPRSPAAPHAVLINEALRYPKRNGATTRYLSEPEVATAYRDRLFGAARQAERITQVEQEAMERLDRGKEPWPLVTLVPDLAGDLTITESVFREFQHTIVSTPAGIFDTGASYQRCSVGRRRLLADGGTGAEPLADWVSLELHSDGSGAYALRLFDLSQHQRLTFDSGEPIRHRVSDEFVVVALLSGVLKLAKFALEKATASGNAVVRARLVSARVAESTGISLMRGMISPEPRGRTIIGEVLTSAEVVAGLDDLAQPCQTFVTTVAILADELGQAFGIPEMGQLSRDGEIRRKYWHRSSQSGLKSWAERHSIVMTDATLQ